MVIGGDGSDIEIHSLKESKLITKFKAHEKRIKAGEVIKPDGKNVYLITASNDGFIKLWAIHVNIFLFLKEKK